ncbi:hypothetical protein LIN78_04785 [Leeia sp. TBRC 13508]|uniref:Lipoprotein n=1 Tax=Leeia speluncae TaxID=2884804 RepID=A0ABS8D3U6_9NEIS|nr:hypothetical protein [Leeia speluncae]MCB6182865.1 hypothetical protein [Leeia speluncae]
MRLSTFLLLSLPVAFLTACASVAVSDDAIKENTAMTLGVSKDSLTILNRQDSGIKTTYQAKTKSGKIYSCYVTGSVGIVGRVVSDAMCNTGSKLTEKATTGSCNELLKAAKKC